MGKISQIALLLTTLAIPSAAQNTKLQSGIYNKGNTECIVQYDALNSGKTVQVTQCSEYVKGSEPSEDFWYGWFALDGKLKNFWKYTINPKNGFSVEDDNSYKSRQILAAEQTMLDKHVKTVVRPENKTR